MMNPRLAAIAASGAIFLIGCLALAAWAGAGFLASSHVSAPNAAPGRVPVGTLGLGSSLDDLLNNLSPVDPGATLTSPAPKKSPSPSPSPPFSVVTYAYSTIVGDTMSNGHLTSVKLCFTDHSNCQGKPLLGACTTYSTSWGASGGQCAGSGSNFILLTFSASPAGRFSIGGTASWPSQALAAKLNHGHVATGSWTRSYNGPTDAPSPSPAPTASPTDTPAPSPDPSPAPPPACSPDPLASPPVVC